MSATATIEFRIDPKQKKELQEVCSQLGVSLSGAMKMMANHLRKEKTIPKQTLTENGWTPEFEEKLLADVEWTKKYGKSYHSVEEFMDTLFDGE